MAPLAILLLGPTASGKTALAERLAARFPLGIVSVDSALVYRGMDVGTAKPDAATLARAPHRLIDLVEPTESYSAARFRADALAAMADIVQAGRTPLLVGGTMLYVKALCEGLSDLPSADPALRAGLDARLAREGSVALHAELARVDPDAAKRIHPNDPQRIQRALEVWYATGEPISARQGRREAPADYRYVKLAVAPADRAELHRRIAARFHAMMAQGFLDEVRRLRARGDLTPRHPAMRAVGYRQLWAHLDGEGTLEAAVERGIHATRQLAKRQLTWLRSMEGVAWFDAAEPAVGEAVEAAVGEALAGRGA
jgi:tRNA dimethylallyltransferase